MTLQEAPPSDQSIHPILKLSCIPRMIMRVTFIIGKRSGTLFAVRSSKPSVTVSLCYILKYSMRHTVIDGYITVCTFSTYFQYSLNLNKLFAEQKNNITELNLH